MPEIYLHIEGKQAGPYSVAQVQQLLAEGKATKETPAWYQGMGEWSTLDKVLAALPATGAPSALPPPPTKNQQGMKTCLIVALILGTAGFASIFVFACLAGMALGPINVGIIKAKETVSMQQARSIDVAMFAYSNDHNGVYPDGKTSTEVFQKLLDEKYISDPGVLYIAMPGKTKATSNTLTADNVCFDVTSGISTDSPDSIPVVFLTGFNISYTPAAAAMKDPSGTIPFPGIAVAYKDNSARFLKLDPDGTVPNFISVTFNPGAKTYQQLRP